MAIRVRVLSNGLASLKLFNHLPVRFPVHSSAKGRKGFNGTISGKQFSFSTAVPRWSTDGGLDHGRIGQIVARRAY